MQQTGNCPNCGSPIGLGQRFCGGCGGQLPAGCPYCGAAVTPGFRFCSNCGGAVSGGMPQQPGGVPQQPGGMPQQPGWGQQQPAWGQAVAGRRSSMTPLLILLLVVLLAGLGGLVYYQFGDQLTGMFSSSTGTDTTAPQITNVVASADNTSATITWSTDELASSQVEYGLESGYGTTTLLENDPASATSMGVINHSMELPDLDPETTYHYRVKSKDEAGNQSESADATFETEAVPVE